MFGNCQDCQYFDLLPDRRTKMNADNGGIGNCMLDPPVPQTAKDGRRAMAQFPMVIGKMGCYQFHPTNKIKEAK